MEAYFSGKANQLNYGDGGLQILIVHTNLRICIAVQTYAHLIIRRLSTVENTRPRKKWPVWRETL
jgi:hypothetical protein